VFYRLFDDLSFAKITRLHITLTLCGFSSLSTAQGLVGRP
jgi:hypothetical protein